MTINLFLWGLLTAPLDMTVFSDTWQNSAVQKLSSGSDEAELNKVFWTVPVSFPSDD